MFDKTIELLTSIHDSLNQQVVCDEAFTFKLRYVIRNVFK